MQLLKKILFQTHWLLGITGGIVLAFIGVTGAVLSFENELVTALNDGIVTVAPRDEPRLTPPELLARAAERNPARRVMSLDVAFESSRAPRVGFAPLTAPVEGPRRPEWRYVDPYTAEPLGEVRAEAFFRTTRDLHRYLAAGDMGKQIVGASTAALLVLALSGLYLRWPRGGQSWRAWLSIDRRLTGRAFLFRLHAVVGTFVLPLYLVAALTGLTWSYESYRAYVYVALGAPAPQRPGGPPPAANRGEPVDVVAALESAWPIVVATAGVMRSATITLQESKDRPIEVRYFAPDAPHERAMNRLVIDAAGNVAAQENFADKPTGARLAGSIFPLHRGSYFGVVGTLLMMVASMLMPLFAVTGILMYLARRRRMTEATLPAWQPGDT